MAKKTEPDTALPELKTALKEKKLSRLYFFHGEETFLMHHYLGQMRKLLIDGLTESFNFHKLTAENYDLQAFVDAVENLPMMAESTMVWVDEIDIFKLQEVDRNKLCEVLADIPEYCTVVFTYETTAWKPDRRLKKLWDTVCTYGKIVEFPKQDQHDLIPWVIRHFAARKKSVSSGLAAYLIEITGGTMTALSGEIQKICAYSGSDTICQTDIDAVTEPVLDAVVFQMTDMLGAKNYGGALKKVQQLLKMQEEPILILGAIGGHFRRLSTAKQVMASGRGPGELFKLLGMKEYVANKTMESARRFTPEFLKRASELILETDYRMKTSFDDPQRLLELLILQLAQEANL